MAYCRWDKNAATLAEVKELEERGDRAGLAAIMTDRLQFGTAGIRGRMGAGFGRMNDLVIIQARIQDIFLDPT